MKNMWKFILIGLGVIVSELGFVALFSTVFNGLSQTESVVVGTGFFLAFEMVICTGTILSKFDKNK